MGSYNYNFWLRYDCFNRSSIYSNGTIYLSFLFCLAALLLAAR